MAREKPKNDVTEAVAAELATAEEVVRPDHYVEATLSSVSRRPTGELRLNQEIILREFADDGQGLVTKNFAIAAALIPAVTSAMAGMASEAFNVPGIGKK